MKGETAARGDEKDKVRSGKKKLEKHQAAEIFFETFNCPALFMSAQPLLALSLHLLD